MGRKKDPIHIQRWKAFVKEYLANGLNGTQAYKKVYKDVTSENGACASASQLLRNPKVQELLLHVQESIDKTKIMDIQELQEYWTVKTKTSKDENIQVKCSELLAKSQGAFIDKQEIKIEKDIEIILPEDDDFEGDDE